MRAIVVSEYGPPDRLTIQQVEPPRPAAGQVAIDVLYAGVNYAEVMARAGQHPNFVPPFTPGLEVSGRIREIADDVEGFAVGQPVCALTTRGGYAEVALASAALTYPLAGDADRDYSLGAALPTVVPTAWSLIQHVGRLRPGENVLIHAAAGGVGSIAGQVARLAGAGAVFGVTSSQTKADYAKGFGYDEVFLGADWDRQARQSSPDGLDLILDSVGGTVRATSFELLAPLGRLALYGNASGEPETGVAGPTLRASCKATLGFSIMALAAAAPARLRAIANDAFAAVARGEVRLDVTQTFSLEQAARAHDLLEGRISTGKLLLAVQTP